MLLVNLSVLYQCPSDVEGDPEIREHLAPMLNSDTRKFLMLLADTFPELGTMWKAQLRGNYCRGVLGISCDIGASRISVELPTPEEEESSVVMGTLPELPSAGLDGSNVMVGSFKAVSVGLTGSLPASWGALKQLRYLILSHNNITGTLPISYTGLSNLQDLMLNDNQLSGPLPAEWGGGMSNVEGILLNRNMLTGTVPDSWGSLPNLVTVDISYNRLEGGLPSWGDSESLMFVDFSHNNMTGTLSPSFARLSLLQTLGLRGNAFCGCVAEGWADSKILRRTLDGMGANGKALQAADCATANACAVRS